MNSQYVQWHDQRGSRQALWISEANRTAPKHLICADDTLSAEKAHQLASEGNGLIWVGDFQNARHLLQALTRRLSKAKQRAASNKTNTALSPLEQFHRHRMTQAQHAHILNSILIPIQANHQIDLRRAPDVVTACTEALGELSEPYVLTLRQLQAIIAAHEWRKKGVWIPTLNAHIHPYYGVFSPIRGEYLELIARAPLPKPCETAWDIGTGTGVISALLARRGIAHIIATDTDARALSCAQENIQRLGLTTKITLRNANLFPEAENPVDLIVCNPPWLPAKPSSPVERAVFDENSSMLKGFLAGVAQHLTPHGQAWLIISDLAEHLGLRAPDEIPNLITQNNLTLIHRYEIRPQHSKSFDPKDPLHIARAKEITSLWRLVKRD